MCGRFTLRTPARELAEQFSLLAVPATQLRFNIAPTQMIGTIRQAAESTIPAPSTAPSVPQAAGCGKGEWVSMQWGLIPSWSADAKMGQRMINARSETAAEKPAFRGPFRRRRCLIAADGFYEWKPLDNGKQPMYIHRRDGKPFAFAGLWDSWQAPGAELLLSCTILTTGPNELLKTIHDRMPVILDLRDYDLWLDPAMQDKPALLRLLKPCPAVELAAEPVSTRVNNPRFDDPRCIEPAIAPTAPADHRSSEVRITE